MKKIASVLLALALLLCLLPLPAQAADAGFRLYMTFDKDKEYYEVGDTVTAQLHLDRVGSTDSYPLYSFSCTILYRPLYLEYQDSSQDPVNIKSLRVAASAASYNSNFNMVSVNYNILGATPPTRAASLVLAQFKFKALARVSSDQVTYYRTSLAIDSLHTPVTLNTEPGVYSIGKPAPTYAVTFSGGTGATGIVPVLSNKAEGDVFQLPENPLKLEGSTFTGWSDGAGTYPAGSVYTMPGRAVSFTAQWKKDPVKHHLTFTGGTGATGTPPTMEDRLANDKIALPTQNTLVSGELVFAGWKYGAVVYQPGGLFTMPDEDVVFTAQWKEAGEAGSGSDGWTSPYADVREGAWYYSAVAFVDGRGLMGSVGGGRFDPDGIMTRAMLVTILYRMAGSPAVTASNPFTDVPSGQWYTNAVVWAASAGLVNGYGDGRFGPADPLTRAQLIAVLWRNAGSPAAKNASAASGFSDSASLGAWAAPAAAWAVENSILNGVGGRLLPNGNATRAQFAAIISRM